MSYGLGIRSLRNVNKAMVGKWLWHLGMDSQGLSHRIFVEKYSLDVSGWVTPMSSYIAFGMWKSILSVKADFNNCIRYWAHNGLKLKFFDDNS